MNIIDFIIKKFIIRVIIYIKYRLKKLKIEDKNLWMLENSGVWGFGFSDDLVFCFMGMFYVCGIIYVVYKFVGIVRYAMFGII